MKKVYLIEPDGLISKVTKKVKGTGFEQIRRYVLKTVNGFTNNNNKTAVMEMSEKCIEVEFESGRKLKMTFLEMCDLRDLMNAAGKFDNLYTKVKYQKDI